MAKKPQKVTSGPLATGKANIFEALDRAPSATGVRGQYGQQGQQSGQNRQGATSTTMPVGRPIVAAKGVKAKGKTDAEDKKDKGKDESKENARGKIVKAAKGVKTKASDKSEKKFPDSKFPLKKKKGR